MHQDERMADTAGEPPHSMRAASSSGCFEPILTDGQGLIPHRPHSGRGAS